MEKREMPKTEVPVEEEEDKGDSKSKEDSEKPPAKKNQLQEKEEELSELKDSYLRLKADTENFKRRMREEKAKDIRFANERLIKDFLPLYENLDRALTAPEINIQSLKLGVDMIFKEFTSILEKEKIKLIPTIGEIFDPTFHEALSQVESNDHDDQTVIQEISKGFLINDRVLCPAKVVISKKSPDTLAEEKTQVDPVSGEKKASCEEKKSKSEKPRKSKKHKDKD